jgi:hypothetical protein
MDILALGQVNAQVRILGIPTKFLSTSRKVSGASQLCTVVEHRCYGRWSGGKEVTQDALDSLMLQRPLFQNSKKEKGRFRKRVEVD